MEGDNKGTFQISSVVKENGVNLCVQAESSKVSKIIVMPCNSDNHLQIFTIGPNDSFQLASKPKMCIKKFKATLRLAFCPKGKNVLFNYAYNCETNEVSWRNTGLVFSVQGDKFIEKKVMQLKGKDFSIVTQ